MFDRKSRILVVDAVVYFPVSVTVYKTLTDESDVGLSEENVVSSIVGSGSNDDLRDLIKSKAKCEMLRICESGKIPEPEMDDYTYEVVNKEDLYG